MTNIKIKSNSSGLLNLSLKESDIIHVTDIEDPNWDELMIVRCQSKEAFKLTPIKGFIGKDVIIYTDECSPKEISDKILETFGQHGIDRALDETREPLTIKVIKNLTISIDAYI